MKATLKSLVLLFLALTLLSFNACDKAKQDVQTDAATSAQTTPDTNPIIKAEQIQKLPKLVDLGSTRCNTCKKMAPILDELAESYKGVFEVEFIDVVQAENKAKADAYGISRIPTQIFFDADGKELQRHEGFMSKEDILNKWKEAGYTFEERQIEGG